MYSNPLVTKLISFPLKVNHYMDINESVHPSGLPITMKHCLCSEMLLMNREYFFYDSSVGIVGNRLGDLEIDSGQ
jgi:hypothetical protein